MKDLYRPRTSTLGAESQLTALLCEIYVCAAMAGLCDEFTLIRPRQGGRTPEFEAALAGQRLCGEVKRYPWKEEGEVVDTSEVRLGVHSRAKSLAQKLDDDLRPKFSAGLINLGFVHRPSLGDIVSHPATFSAILGFAPRALPSGIRHSASVQDLRNALCLVYNMPDWSVVSGIFLVRLNMGRFGECLPPEACWFPNPRAATTLSSELASRIRDALSQRPC